MKTTTCSRGDVLIHKERIPEKHKKCNKRTVFLPHTFSPIERNVLKRATWHGALSRVTDQGERDQTSAS
jgi:hypothetical protein